MAESVDEKWSIDKLNASNWMTWKFQMRHLLLAKGLWGYVDGSEVLAEALLRKQIFARSPRRRSQRS